MSPLSAWIQSNQLKAWSAVQADPQYAFLKAAAGSVGELIQIVDRMGWQSLGEAVEALKTLNTLVEFVADTPVSKTLSFDRSDLKSVDQMWLRGMLTADAFEASTVNKVAASNDRTHVTFSDDKYGVLTKAQILEIAAKTPTATLKYVPEVMDCDDFAFALKGWLAEQGLGNTSIGPAYVSLYDDGKIIDKHAALIAIDVTGNAWWVEPQNGGVYDIQEIYITGAADKAVITDWIL